MALLPIPLFAGPELEPLRRIAIQDGGRAKPLDSFARDLAKRVQGARAFGLDRIEGLEPTEWLLAMMAAPEKWRDQPIIKVTHAGLRKAAVRRGTIFLRKAVEFYRRGHSRAEKTA